MGWYSAMHVHVRAVLLKGRSAPPPAPLQKKARTKASRAVA